MSLRPATGRLPLPVLLAALAVAAAGVTSSPPTAAAKPRALEAEETHKVHKRYVAALARNGDLPFSVRREWHKKLHPAVSAHRGLQAALGAAPNPYGVPGKRYDQLSGNRDDDQQRQEDDSGAAKRGISTLAKNGQLPAPLATGDNRSEDGGNGDSVKRGGVAALARLGYLPPHKKNLDWLYTDLQQAASEPMKRHVGTLARNFILPAAGKRNVGSLARGGGFSALRYLPNAPRSGKRGDDGPVEGNDDNFMEYEEDENASEDNYAEEIVKRYIATLLRQGRLPVGGSGMDARDEVEPLDEEKRHLGALRRLGKKTPSPIFGLTLESPMSPMRTKRNAAFPSNEYSLPTYQSTDHGDQVTYDQFFQELTVPEEETPEKRFLGRIPQMGRSRGRAPSPLRRGRPRSRNI